PFNGLADLTRSAGAAHFPSERQRVFHFQAVLNQFWGTSMQSLRRWFRQSVLRWWRSVRRPVPRRFRPETEALEGRALLSTVLYSSDGSGNNLASPAEGSAGTDLIRIAPPAYADGISAPAGATLPGARPISDALSDQTDPNNPSEDVNTVNQKLLSDYIYVFGQFLDHDLDLTPDS